MRLIKFKGSKVHDYLTIDLLFNSDLSIITGSNGSGKTTAILLLQALLCPNFKDLIFIPFEHLELVFAHKGAEHTISAHSDQHKIVIRANSISKPLEIIKEKYEELEYFAYKHKEGSTDINEIILKGLGSHELLDFIKQIPSPIFIGLERRSDEVRVDREDYLIERRHYMHKGRREYADFKRQFKGSLGVSLLETEFLIQGVYRRLRAVEDHYSTNLHNEILLSSFEYIQFDSTKSFSNSYQEKRNLLDRRKEIEDALNRIGSNRRADFTEKLKVFFDKLESLFDGASKDTGINIEWLTNQYQIDKLSKLLEIIDDYKSNAAKAFKPINIFLDTINSFFKDSGKSLHIDEVGHLFVKRPNAKKDAPIDALSSGERQIVILFANVMFNKVSSESKENILFIDEPELSLHIKWQEIFIEKLLAVSQNTQFILATHSPDIVGEYKSKGIKINQSRSNVG